MVGAKQSDGHRTQYMARTPWSQPSFLSDVQQSILEAVVDGNNAFLPAWQAQTPPPGSPFSKPIFSRLGTREPYRARAIPYFDSTDHLVFNDPWVRVPGTSLTNWPDEYIHSSADDLWQIDATQLKRNAFVVAATAWWLANADAKDVPFLAAFVAARGSERLAANLAAAQAWLRDGKGNDDERRRAAADLARGRGADRGRSRRVDPVDRGRLRLRGCRERRQRSGPREPLSPRGFRPVRPVKIRLLARLAARTPRFAVTTLDAWLALEKRVADKRVADKRAERERKEARRGGAPQPRKAGAKTTPAPPDDDSPKLSALMGSAAMTWIDGKTNAAEIARRVCAEALAAGWWYYGETTPAMVERFLRGAGDGTA